MRAAETAPRQRGESVPEIALWSAVVLRAVFDAQSVPAEFTFFTDCSQARAFLTAKTGAWAESREAILTAIGFDPEAVRERFERRFGTLQC